MKLIIQIPCFNEEKTLGLALSNLPREVDGVDSVEWLIVDDGSTDKTVDVAKAHGVDYIVSHPRNHGLAKAFMTGLGEALRAGANIIVNTDADNQYCADDIPKLIKPILDRKADMVVGARPIDDIEHFSPMKKLLQKLGSWVIRKISNTNIPDAPSGFRAISRDAAMRLNVFSRYTYTLETIIQAGQKNMAVTYVPIRTNPDIRPSRLVKSIPRYIGLSVSTMGRIFVTYRPLLFFFSFGFFVLLVGALIGARFLFYYLSGDGGGHIQSLILSALLVGMGFQLIVLGIVADLIAVNRKLLEKIDYHTQRIEIRSGSRGQATHSSGKGTR
jgi:glycosyltransferase involved in cell wall biosynthesis